MNFIEYQSFCSILVHEKNSLIAREFIHEFLMFRIIFLLIMEWSYQMPGNCIFLDCGSFWYLGIWPVTRKLGCNFNSELIHLISLSSEWFWRVRVVREKSYSLDAMISPIKSKASIKHTLSPELIIQLCFQKRFGSCFQMFWLCN